MAERIPLVLLPGMVSDAAYWQAQIENLSDIVEATVVAFGALDHFGAMAEMVLAQAPARFALAGHSMGGRVVQDVYRRAPERVLKLALLATDYRRPASESARQKEVREREEMLALAAEQGMEAFARGWLIGLLAPQTAQHPDLVETMVAMIARHSVRELTAHTLAALRRPDCTAVIDAIDVPTLILAGEFDPLRPVSVHQEMAERIRNSRLVVIERSGHMLAMEQPRAVTQIMREWLLL
ncbi:MAG TPA: alpha/beta hydrolase [Rhizomicrobium sp.]|jgi:pimeloyl-ACP methyl ester carboxylesterase